MLQQPSIYYFIHFIAFFTACLQCNNYSGIWVLKWTRKMRALHKIYSWHSASKAALSWFRLLDSYLLRFFQYNFHFSWKVSICSFHLRGITSPRLIHKNLNKARHFIRQKSCHLVLSYDLVARYHSLSFMMLQQLLVYVLSVSLKAIWINIIRYSSLKVLYVKVTKICNISYLLSWGQHKKLSCYTECNFFSKFLLTLKSIVV